MTRCCPSFVWFIAGSLVATAIWWMAAPGNDSTPIAHAATRTSDSDASSVRITQRTPVTSTPHAMEIALASAPAPVPDDGKLRIICFGAHPDDCELRAAGVAAKWAALGHHVKFVSVTNGDIGHWQMAGGPLAQRRTAEVKRCADILGIESQVLDIHDGELLPTLENRRTITRIIREWQADIVMCHRPNDYHPDHRNVGLLVQDAAYMVTVPFLCPDVPYLTKNPVFLFYEDRFQKPNPFQADVVVSIDDVLEKKMACVDALESQFYEGGCCSNLTELPQTSEEQTKRQTQVRESFRGRFAGSANRFRDQLKDWYGADQGEKVGAAEAFEVSEYGRQPTRDELRALFPFFGTK